MHLRAAGYTSRRVGPHSISDLDGEHSNSEAPLWSNNKSSRLRSLNNVENTFFHHSHLGGNDFTASGTLDYTKLKTSSSKAHNASSLISKRFNQESLSSYQRQAQSTFDNGNSPETPSVKLDARGNISTNHNSNNNTNKIWNWRKQDRIKLMELSITNLVELSAFAAKSQNFEVALKYAKEALSTYDNLRSALQEQPSTSRFALNQQGHLDQSHPVSTSADPSTGSISPLDRTAHAHREPTTTNINLFELALMVKCNLAGQLRNCGRLSESLEIYSQLCKMATNSAGAVDLHDSSSSPLSSQQYDARFILCRFGMNIGNLLYEMKDYPRALKHYRLTLDRLSAHGYKSIRIKIMNNISLALIKHKHQNQPDVTTSLNLLLADNFLDQEVVSMVDTDPPSSKLLNVCNSHHHRYALNLIACLHARNDLSSMMDTLKSLVRVGICHHYKRVFDLDVFYQANCESNRDGHLPIRKDDVTGPLAKSSPLNSRTSTADSNQFNNVQGTATRLISSHKTDPSVPTDDWSNSDSTHSAAGCETGKTTATTYSKFHSVTPAEKYKHVMSIIAEDKLELLIVSKNNQVSRTLVMSVNLMLDLARRAHGNQQNSSSTSWILDFCFKILSTSETYKNLIIDIKTGCIGRILERTCKLEQVLRIFNQFYLEEQQVDISKNLSAVNASLTVGHAAKQKIQTSPESLKSTSMATNLSFLHLWLDETSTQALNSALESVRLDPKNANAIINLANAYFHSNCLEKAELLYNKAFMLEPSNWIACYNLFLVGRLKNRHIDEIDCVAYETLTKDPQSISKQIYQRMFLVPIQLAIMMQQSGKLQESISLFDELLGTETPAPEVSLAASKLPLNDVGPRVAQKRDPIELLKQANREHPYHLPVAERLTAMHINRFDYESAENQLSECIKNRPDQVKWYQMLAESYRRATKYDMAIMTYKLAIDKFPNDTNCLKALLKLSEELGLEEDKKFSKAKLDRLQSRRTNLSVGVK